MTLRRRLYLIFITAPMMLFAIVFCSILDTAIFLLREIKVSTLNAYLTLKAAW